MQKLSLQVMIPAIGKSHDFIVPDSMVVSKVIQLMAATISEEYGVSKSLNNIVLVDAMTNKVLNNSCSFRQMGITNGTKLMLF